MKKADKITQNVVANQKSFSAKNNAGGFLGVQAKLKIGEPNDKYEQEADRVADSVTRKQSDEKSFFPPNVAYAVQTKPITEGITSFVQKAEDEEVQTKPMIQKEEEEEEAQPKLKIQCEEEEEMAQTQPIEEEEELLQPKRENNNGASPTNTNGLLKQSRGKGSPLSNKVKSEMEHGFGADFSKVKVHTNQQAITLSKSLGAQAFTLGNDIYFNKGKYNPETNKGKHLLAHELTHTVQQGASMANAVQRETEAVSSPSTSKTTGETSMCDETIEREKQKFIAKGKYGPKTSPKGYGSFDATYYTGIETLDIAVRGKTRFKDGLKVGAINVVSQDDDLKDLATILNVINDPTFSAQIVNTYYSWGAEQKKRATENFKLRLAEAVQIWENKGKFGFYIDEPCWEDILAFVSITLDVQQAGDANVKGKKDHIQVTLIKNPNRNEKDTVSALVKSKIKKVQKERQQSLAVNRDADLTTTSNVAQNGEMTLTNRSVKDTPGELQNFKRSSLRKWVYFKNNRSNLDSTDKSTIDSFLKEYKNVDGIKKNSEISLIGHASKSGTTEYNRKLVDKRLDSVYKYLKKKGVTNIKKRKEMTNKSDNLAEKYEKTNKDSWEFRSVELLVGSGELQNTVAHEFGHVFEMDDEYVTPTDEVGSGLPMGDKVPVNSKMSKDIGAREVVAAEDNDNIMSVGNEVRKQHYGAFGMMLNKVTGKSWKIF